MLVNLLIWFTGSLPPTHKKTFSLFCNLAFLLNSSLKIIYFFPAHTFKFLGYLDSSAYIFGLITPVILLGI